MCARTVDKTTYHRKNRFDFHKNKDGKWVHDDIGLFYIEKQDDKWFVLDGGNTKISFLSCAEAKKYLIQNYEKLL